ncbi:MAG: YjgP/YjgQ family permease [Clostridia bacterium]|nr:YjgP/YjgQ family permease [Clostridia bacterium]
MRIVTRYILRELLGPFFFGLFLFGGILIGNIFVSLTQLAQSYGLPFSTVLRLLVYQIPENLAYGMPMAILLGTLIGLGKMTGHSETIAMQAGGVSYFRIALPVLLTGLLVSVATLVLNENVVPEANRAYREERAAVTGAVPKGVIRNHFLTDSGPTGKRLLYAEEYYPAEERMVNVLIQEVEKDRVVRTIQSQELFWSEEDYGWFFLEGEIYQYEGEKVFPIRVGKGFSGLTRTPREVVQLARQKPGEMSWSELQWYIKNNPQLSEGEIRNLQVQLHLKTAIPFACFFFALLGTPLGLQPQRRTSSAGFGLSFLFVFIYYLLMGVGSVLGRAGTIPPALGAWFQNILFGVFGGWQLLRKAR